MAFAPAGRNGNQEVKALVDLKESSGRDMILLANGKRYTVPDISRHAAYIERLCNVEFWINTQVDGRECYINFPDGWPVELAYEKEEVPL